MSGIAGAGVLLGFLLGTTTGWRILAPALLSVVDHSEASRRCDDWIGQMAAVVSGRSERFRERCRQDPLDGERTRVLLGRIAADRRRPAEARFTALRVLVEGRPGLAQEVMAVLSDTEESPGFHRQALHRVVRAQGGAAWAEEPARLPAHGMFDVALLEGAVDGLDPEPAATVWSLRGSDRSPEDRAAVLEALGVSADELRTAVARATDGRASAAIPAAWRTVIAETSCEPSCDRLLTRLLAVEGRNRREGPPEPAPALAGDDAVLDVLFGEAGEHVRWEIGAVLDWAAANPDAQTGRLLAVLASPAADRLSPGELLEEAGDPHAVLRHANGSVGAVAVLAELLGPGAGGAHLRMSGARLYVESAGDVRVVEPCQMPEAVAEVPANAHDLPARGGAALALRDRAGFALRAGVRDDAELYVQEAVTRWADVPGLSTLRASLLAAHFAALRPMDGVARPPRVELNGHVGWGLGAGLLVATVDPPVTGVRGRALRQAAAAVQAEAKAEDDLVFASWWAFAYGDGELARLLLPKARTGAVEDLRMAVVIGLGEPGRPVGPWSRAMAGVPVEELSCVDPGLPWPFPPDGVDRLTAR